MERKISNKMIILYNALLFAASILSSGCDTGPFDIKPDKPNTGGDTPSKELPFDEGQQEVYDAKTPTLLEKTGWKCDTLANGVVYYNFERYDEVSQAAQIVNVLELDLTSDKYKVDFAYRAESDTCSHMIETRRNAGIDVLGGVNVNYELDATYMRINGIDVSKVTIPSNHLRFWKHEGAVLGYKDGSVRVRLSDRSNGVKAIENYANSTATNLCSSSPSLIEDYQNIGSTFVDKERLASQLDNLDYEDKDRHQGVRHPRTAVAVTGDGDLLLITVDGRWPDKAEGMTCDELTRFIIKYFKPRYALNLDGGGSTVMCVKGHGEKTTNVVNYPTDNKVFNHFGQRKRELFLLIEKK